MLRTSAVLGITFLCCLVVGCGSNPPSVSPDAGDTDVQAGLDALGLDVPVPEENVVDVPACPSGQTRCGDRCVSVQTDPTHCGGCAVDCTTLPNVDPAGVACVDSRCTVSTACRTGTGDCDGVASNGCETDLTAAAHCGRCETACSGETLLCTMVAGVDGGTERHCANGCTSATPTRCGSACVETSSDPLHCGSCTGSCTTPSNGTVACIAGACSTICNAGFHRCGTLCQSNESPDSCGAACTPCAPPPANAVATCTGGVCGSACMMGFHRCDDRCVSNMSPSSCGASCSPCEPPPNGRASCDGTACGVVCNAGFHLCGTECVSNTSLNTCGTSCAPCAGTPNGSASCDGLTCGITCSPGFHDCAGRCVSSSDIGSCGTRCAACPMGPAGTTPTCTAGACSTECLDGYHRCGGSCVLTTSVAGCGSSCDPCAVPTNATSTCDGNACGYTCRAGFADCDGAATNGCEGDLSLPTSCGACSTNCLAPGPHTAPTCEVSSGVRSCGVRCEAGWTDCDANLANGCEALGACFTAQTLFTEDFEATSYPRWSLELPWHRWASGTSAWAPFHGFGTLTTAAYNTFECRIEGYTTMTSDLDVSRAVSVSLQFDSFTHRGATDGYAIEVSTDRGATWTRAGFSAATVSDWESRSVDLSAFSGSSTLRFRFYYLTICPGTRLEWSIDNVSVTARVRTY
jgi:hypothetical protein